MSTNFERLTQIKKLREQRALIALAKAKNATAEMTRKLTADTELRVTKTEILDNYMQQKIEELKDEMRSGNYFMTLSIGHFRRKREVVLAEIQRRKTRKELHALEKQAAQLGEDWQRAQRKTTQAIEMNERDMERISEAHELDNEEETLELLMNRDIDECNA